MKLEKFKNIIQQYLADGLSKEQHDNVDHWFDVVAKEEGSPFADEQHRQRIQAELLAAMPIQKSENIKPKRTILWKRIAVAAAVLLFLSFGLLYLKEQPHYTNYSNQKVVLTEIATDIGEIRKVRLPDSTVISLNGNTKIAFDAQDFNHNRKVILKEGEAFFAVKRDTLHPFSIVAGEVGVKVLGTSFNVNYAVKAKRITVDVKTGRVEVNSSTTKTAFQLTPGQGIHFDSRNNSFVHYDIDAEHSNLWVQGGMLLNGVTFEELQELIYNRYGLKLSSEHINTDSFSYSLFIPKVESVDHIMQMIESIHQLKYRRSADGIILYK